MPIDREYGSVGLSQFEHKPRAILASGSPRRRLLLPLVCPVKTCVSTDTDETPNPGESSAALAVRLAEAKLAVARSMLGQPDEPAIIVAADTVVSLDEQP